MSDTFTRLALSGESYDVGYQRGARAGLGLCCNLLVTPQTRPGIPFHILCRRILASSSIGEALGVLITSESGASGNFPIAHAESEAVDIVNRPSSICRHP